MNVLQVSPYVVYPPNDGGSHRTHGLVAQIPAYGGHVARYCQGVSSAEYRHRDFRRTVRISQNYIEHRHVNVLHDVAKFPMLLNYPNLFSGWALSHAPGPLNSLAVGADVVIVRGPWQVEAVADLVDLPIVYSSNNVETERFDSLSGSMIGRWAYDRVQNLERTALSVADLVVCTSERDSERYRRVFNHTGHITVAPNATARSNLREHHPESKAAKRVREKYGFDSEDVVATFVGSKQPANVEAVETLISGLEHIDDDVKFLIIGSVSDAFFSAPKNVTLAGFVENFEAHLDATDIALNPVTFGGGSNIKLLDYFARSLPVVSTHFGVRGFDVEDGTEAIVIDLPSFPDVLNTLSRDQSWREQLGAAARDLVDRCYTWDNVSRDFYDLLKSKFNN